MDEELSPKLTEFRDRLVNELKSSALTYLNEACTVIANKSLDNLSTLEIAFIGGSAIKAITLLVEHNMMYHRK